MQPSLKHRLLTTLLAVVTASLTHADPLQNHPVVQHLVALHFANEIPGLLPAGDEFGNREVVGVEAER